ncbi:MAG TPA: extracellular solute-binding protein [Phototrophicaceae bacterium]|nr:extracellular solute-binding protein [Phototrophicaceae bacterium]
MSRRIRFAVLALIVFAAAFSFGSVSAQGKVTINWWHISTDPKQAAYWQGLADQYTAAHPNVEIKITILDNDPFKQKLVTVMQAGDPPDLFQSWGGAVLWTYAENGLVRNIAPELSADNGAWQNSFAVPAALDLYGQNGEYYGVPWDWGAVGLFYNKALFKQAGITDVPTTWSQFLDDVKTLKAAGITPISLGEGEEWPGHFWWVYLATREGGKDAFLKAYNRSGSFADPSFVKAGEDLQQLIDLQPFQDGFLGMNHNDSEGVFGNGKAAMELQGQWGESAQAQYSTDGKGIGADNLGWFNFPMVEGGAGNANDVFGGGNGIAVGKNAPDEAVDFLKFLTTAQNNAAAAFFAVPTVKGTESAITDPILQQIVQARNNAPYFQLYYDQFLPPAVGNEVNDAVATIFAGTASPQDAAQAIEDVAAQNLTAQSATEEATAAS